MPEQQKTGFLSGWKGNLAQRALRAGADFLMPGSQRAPDGTLQNVGSGMAGLAGKVGAGLLLGPAGASLAGKVIGAGIDSGGQNWIPYGNGPLASLMGHGSQNQFDSQLAQSQQQMQQQIAQRGGLPAVAYTGFGAVPQATQTPNIPTMPRVQAEAPWTGSLAGSNPFGGAYGGNLGLGASAPRAYGRAAGAFTPNGAGIVQVAGNGWAGSDAAAGFGLGAQGAGASSSGAIALSDAIALHKKFAR